MDPSQSGCGFALDMNSGEPHTLRLDNLSFSSSLLTPKAWREEDSSPKWTDMKGRSRPEMRCGERSGFPFPESQSLPPNQGQECRNGASESSATCQMGQRGSAWGMR
jgi:hypothetical protein